MKKNSRVFWVFAGGDNDAIGGMGDFAGCFTSITAAKKIIRATTWRMTPDSYVRHCLECTPLRGDKFRCDWATIEELLDGGRSHKEIFFRQTRKPWAET